MQDRKHSTEVAELLSPVFSFLAIHPQEVFSVWKNSMDRCVHTGTFLIMKSCAGQGTSSIVNEPIYSVKCWSLVITLLSTM